MAPSWVLLDRNLFFSHDEAVFAGETEGGGEPIGCASKAREGRPSDEEYADAITAYLRSLKPVACLADPPELSSLSMLRPTESIPPLCDSVTSACISSADKHLVALYAGHYRPGTRKRGCYLIYDARNKSLSTIPRLPFDDSHDSIGRHTAVVVCDGDGAGYTLAELVRVESSDVAAAKLYLWHSSAKEWIVRAGSLPLEVCMPDDYFSADMCFHFRETAFCWVDLLKGILVCDLNECSSDPNFFFVPLPKGCITYDILDANCREMVAEVFRSMACVGGVIKFVTMDGYHECQPEELELTLWTLSSDRLPWKWQRSKVYKVENIWANETYQSTGLRKVYPSFPVLSMHEADVVYLVFSDIRQGADKRAELIAQYVLRVDMENHEVQISQASTDFTIHSQLFASEFSADRQCLLNNPLGFFIPNTSPVSSVHAHRLYKTTQEVEASEKRMKL